MQDDPRTSPQPRRRRGLVALLAAAALVAAGAVGAQAITEGKAFEHMRVAAFDGGGWHHRDHRPLDQLSDAEIEERVTRMVRHVSIEIDGTPAQEQQIITVATGAAKELRSLKESLNATRIELRELLTADPIDRTALEALRAARLADADRISKTLVDAVADMAEVLTPEQRGELQALIRERRERHHMGHGGHWGGGHWGSGG